MLFISALSTSSATFNGTVRGLGVAFSAFGLDGGLDALLGRIKGSDFG